jgi:hypothetical protein
MSKKYFQVVFPLYIQIYRSVLLRHLVSPITPCFITNTLNGKLWSSSARSFISAEIFIIV